MATHTPGPWKVNENRTRGQDRIICSTTADTQDDGQVAYALDFGRFDLDAEADANARLIAAAPETAAERDRLKEINAKLLAACYRFMAQGDCAERVEYREIKAAIAKAEEK